jgi:DNA-binding transcriptional MerR regulator
MSNRAIKQLKALRDTGLSTSQIQKELGLRAQETVRRWLRGESNPQPAMCAKIETLSAYHGIITTPAATNPFE